MPDPLESALRALAEVTDYPQTPPLRVTVVQAIRERRAARAPAPRARLMPRRRLVVLAAGGLLLVLASVAVAVRLGMGAIGVRVLPSAGPVPTAVEEGPVLGRPSTLQEAEAIAGFGVVLPSGLGAPERVWLERSWLGRRVVLAWTPKDGLPEIPGLTWGAILMELRPDVGGHGLELAYKDVSPENPIVETRVGGGPALWVTGGHTLTFHSEGEEIHLRVTGNVLIWQEGDVTMRLETALGLPETKRIAGSVA